MKLFRILILVFIATFGAVGVFADTDKTKDILEKAKEINQKVKKQQAEKAANEQQLISKKKAGAETAADFINTASQEKLIKVFFELGEEPKARQIAKLICLRRKDKKILTSVKTHTI